MRRATLCLLSLLATLGVARAEKQTEALLPAGYLSTRGNQIVDRDGNPVRIHAVGWMGPSELDGPPWGLFAISLDQAIASMRQQGFNAIRIAWVGKMLRVNAQPAAQVIDYARNPDLKGLTTLQIIDKVVQAAGAAGLKVILDHHNNEGDASSAAQQPNGLWFDTGPGTDGTNGAGVQGTVSAQQFREDWVAMAKRYKRNATVIGFDLDNEPHSAGRITWGGDGPTDLHRMCTEVGNAIQAVNPGPLIICEGPQEYKRPRAWSGMDPSVAAPEGDLTGVRQRPVVLSVPNKVVYSVHEYPAEIAGKVVDSGLDYIRRMNRAWGFLLTENIAPVFVGEMGSSMSSPDAQAWADTLIPYLNGEDGALGGPTFRPGQQPVSTSWWMWGNGDKIVPNGTLQNDWVTARPEQEAVYSKLRPIPAHPS